MKRRHILLLLIGAALIIGYFSTALAFLDDDGDGIHNNSDNCPQTPNPDQSDLDSDGLGDACDTDDDDDGIADSDDSCPSLSNPMQGTIRLHGPVYHDHDVAAYRISPNSSWVVFSSDLSVNDRVELISSDAVHGTSRVLNPALQAEGDVLDNFDITPDSLQVLFLADVVEEETFDLYRSSIDSGGTAVILNDRPLYDDGFSDYYRFLRLRPDGETVCFVAEEFPQAGPWSWWSIPVAGGPSTQLDAAVVAGPGEFSDDSLYFLYQGETWSGPPTVIFVDTTTLVGEEAYWPTLIPGDFEIVEEASRAIYWGNTVSAWSDMPLVSELLSGGGEVVLQANHWRADVGSVPAAGAIRVVFGALSPPPDNFFLGWYSDRIDGGDRRFLTDDATDNAGRMRVAPDGQSAVYVTYDDLRRIDVLGGTPETIYTPVTTFKFSPDGNWIVFLSEGSLYNVPLNGTETTLIGVGSEEYEISPDSGTILYRTADMRELWAVGMNGGQPLRLNSELVEGGTLGMGTFSPDSRYVVYWANQNHADRTELYRASIELDVDGDTFPAECDYAPEDPTSWIPPSEAGDLALTRTGSVAHLSWSTPELLGGVAVSYTILRSEDPAGFRAGSTETINCLPDGDPNDLSGEDGEIPETVFYYLIRADHGLKGMVGLDRERGETWSCS